VAETCTKCSAPVKYVLTVGGRRVPLEPDPHPAGTHVPVKVGGQTRSRVLGGGELPAQEPAWRDHRTTCSAGKHASDRAARLRPKCRVCTKPMDPELAYLEQWETHPSCDPAHHTDETRTA